ncbi:MAG: hypothetical protein L6R41_006333 [Letrouitia leprolyta]|nr:MAG: hypothetical protein L6R41_006333 [Letrouitia leprolyta]
MSGTKRKQPPGPILSHGISKKQKRVPESIPNNVAQDSDQGFETDSDPIIESDTTEHSGDDDGASWPSDSQSADLAEKAPKPSEGNNVTSKSANFQGFSKEAHAKQKALAQERKAAKPNAESIARTKKLWERLRRKSHVRLEERKELVAELFGIITGNVREFVLKHDSVRVVQTAIKYANLDQRRMIANELKGEFRGLAESRYAKFLLGKLLVVGDKEIRDIIVPEFYGHIRRLIKHPEASWILDDIYRGVGTLSQKAIMLREWFGAEFAIFKAEGKGSVSGELKTILKDYPEKRKPIMHALHDLINLLVQKKTTGFTMLHDAMLQYFLNVPSGSQEMTEFLELLKGDEEGDLLKNLAFTKSGARLVCLALAYGTAKDRKQILRVYKNTFEALAGDANGHQVILAAYDVIDDTVLTSKSIFPELLGKSPEIDESRTQHLLNSVIDLNARVPLLYPFAGKSKAMLRNEDIDLLNEIHGIRSTTSKKDPATRRKELLVHLSPPLLALIAENVEALVQSSFGCQFITEVMLSAIGEREPAKDAIIALTQSSEPEIKQALDAASAGRMLKTLAQGGRFNPKTRKVEPAEPPLMFHDPFYTSLEAQGQVLEWAIGGNSFVIVGLLEANGFRHKRALMDKLRKGRKQLKMAASPSVEGKSKQGKKGEKIHGGNRGAQLLLEKLEEDEEV